MAINKVDINIKRSPNWIFNIRRVNFNHIDYDETIPHQHNFYEILFLEKGEGVHLIDDKEYQVKKNSIHFLSPNHVHQLTLNNNSEGFVCMFKEELFFLNNENSKFLDGIDLFSNWNKNPILYFKDNDFAALKNILNLLLLEFENQQFRKNEILFLYLKIFLIKVSRLNMSSNKNVSGSKQRVLFLFLGLLEEHITNNNAVQFYANKLSITSTYLNRIVNEVYGKSASDFIKERLLLETKRILKFSSKSIKEIAYELGFDDPSYFSRFFKKQVNITPFEYRNNSRR